MIVRIGWATWSGTEGRSLCAAGGTWSAPNCRAEFSLRESWRAYLRTYESTARFSSAADERELPNAVFGLTRIASFPGALNLPADK